MDQRKLYAKTLRYQKAGVDVFFNLVATVQQGGQSIMMQSLENATWLPQSSKKSCISWLDQFSKNTKNLKDAVDQGYDGMDRFLSTDRFATAKKAAAASVKKTEKKSEVVEEVSKPAKAANEPVKPKAAQTKSTIATKPDTRVKGASPRKTASKAKQAEKVTVVASKAEQKPPSDNVSQPEAAEIKNVNVAALENTDAKQAKEIKSGKNIVTEEQQPPAVQKSQETGQ